HPSVNYYIKKRIITDNLFGVDIMEEATEIAKLRLFLALVASVERSEQLEPLPNIDFNILTGNSLIGLLHVDEKDYDELHGQQEMWRESYRSVLNKKQLKIEQYRKAKERLPEALQILRDEIHELRKGAYVSLNEILLRDFTKLGIKFEQATWDEKKDKEGRPQKRAVKLSDVEALHPFHWGFEFDEIINRNGGFDAIITNPPWEIFKPQAKEFFAEHSELVTKKKMTIKEFEKEQSKLLRDAEIRAAWLEYQSRFWHVNSYFRSAPQYANQIAVVAGKKQGTDINLFKLFVEQCFNLLHSGGECGIVIPSGIYTDLGTKKLRELLFDNTEITGLFCFENRKEIFEGVHRSFKFVVLTFKKEGSTKMFPAAFMRHDVNELQGFPKEGAVRISVDLIRRVSPDSLSVMEFKDNIDLKIAEKTMRFPLLGEKIEEKWNLSLTREFHMTDDKDLFKTTNAPGCVQLYEGKMIHQFSHLWGESKYWINEKEGRKALLGRNVKDIGQKLDYQNYRLGFRDITSSTNERTMIAGALPPSVFAGNTIVLSKRFDNLGELLFVTAILNSFICDSIIRQKVTSHCNMFYVYQLPIPRLTEEDPEFAPIVERAAKLICTTPEFDDLAREVGLKDHTEGATDLEERARLRAELDGMIAHLYGLTEEEFAYVLSTFPLVSNEVKDAALAEFKKEAARVKKEGTDGEIRKLIARGESAELEFKSSARWDMKQNKANPAMEQVIVKTVAAFLNSERGGTLLVGVDDEGNVIGLKHDYKMFGKQNSRDAYENFLTSLLLNAFGKDATPLLDITFHQTEAQDVVRVSVKPSPKPIFVKDGQGEHLYIRAGNSTRQLTTKEALDYCKLRWPS
ncbi:MAG TPA: RNA-binding domain-containing protein, partial [Pyrinomonadaceae bacterium]|nr:RNA-binding domain-containing protein [Pyrinomonadaceae bacterium]